MKNSLPDAIVTVKMPFVRPPLKRHSLQKLADEIGDWQEITFPKATEASIIEHLKDEVNNELKPGCNTDEIADCIILLFGLVRWRGLEVEELIMAKFEVNKTRKWGKPNKLGYVEHLIGVE